MIDAVIKEMRLRARHAAHRNGSVVEGADEAVRTVLDDIQREHEEVSVLNGGHQLLADYISNLRKSLDK